MTAAERTRAMRIAFERAQAAGLTVTELRRRDAEDRWRAVDRRLAAKRGDAGAEDDEGLPLRWDQR